MRPELELLERIENYLLGKMSKDEEHQFESEIHKDAQLKKSVEDQQLLMEGLKRTGLKTKIRKGRKQYKFNQFLKFFGLATVVIATILGSTLTYLKTNQTEHFIEDFKPMDQIKLGFDALSGDTFMLPNVDTIVETKSGIVLSIPKDAFVDSAGNAVSEGIKFIVKEALSEKDILLAGLSTTSNGQLLESGGMFELSAFYEGKPLLLDTTKIIIADIPTHNKKEGMLLFDGEKDSVGDINWVKPKKLVNSLKPVDLHSLNFYPPHYEDTLYGIKGKVSKRYKDSLYFSFNSIQNKTSFNGEIIDESDNLLLAVVDTPAHKICGISPQTIKTIWSDKFQHTNVATKEFEERLKALFTLCNNGSEIVELYLKNLDKPLYHVDSMVANNLNANENERQLFQAFAARRDGGVTISNSQSEQLAQYYARKSKAYTEVKKTEREFWKKHKEQDAAFNKLASETLMRASLIKNKNFQMELNINMENAYEQAGLKRPNWTSNNSLAVLNNSFYRAQINSLGAKNIDRFVEEQTTQRKSGSFKVKQTGKTIDINYSPVEVNVKNKEQYDKINVYLLPKELYSFVKLRSLEGNYKYDMNDHLAYDLVVIGFKGEEIYLKRKKDITSGIHTVSIQKINPNKLSNTLARNTAKVTLDDILNQVNFEITSIRNTKRKNKLYDLQVFQKRIRQVILPCCNYEEMDKQEFAELEENLLEAIFNVNE